VTMARSLMRITCTNPTRFERGRRSSSIRAYAGRMTQAPS
jgi:hypothetical protein